MDGGVTTLKWRYSIFHISCNHLIKVPHDLVVGAPLPQNTTVATFSTLVVLSKD